MDNGNKVKQKDKVSIKELRKELGLTQEECARILGVRRETVSDLETGKQISKGFQTGIRFGILLARSGRSPEDLILALPDPKEDQYL